VGAGAIADSELPTREAVSLTRGRQISVFGGQVQTAEVYLSAFRIAYRSVLPDFSTWTFLWSDSP